MPPTPPPPDGFRDSDQAWFDRLSGKAGGPDDTPAAREADALRVALDQEQARLRQAELGWNSNVSYDGATFSLALTDKSGAALEDCIVTARIGHPASSAEDRMVQMEFRDGSYAAETELTPGIWAADVNVTGPRGEVWTREIRFIVKG